MSIFDRAKNLMLLKGTVDVNSIDSSCKDVKFTKAPLFEQQWERYRGSNLWKFILSFHMVLIRKSLNRKPAIRKKGILW